MVMRDERISRAQEKGSDDMQLIVSGPKRDGGQPSAGILGVQHRWRGRSR